MQRERPSSSSASAERQGRPASWTRRRRELACGLSREGWRVGVYGRCGRTGGRRRGSNDWAGLDGVEVARVGDRRQRGRRARRKRRTTHALAQSSAPARLMTKFGERMLSSEAVSGSQRPHALLQMSSSCWLLLLLAAARCTYLPLLACLPSEG